MSAPAGARRARAAALAGVWRHRDLRRLSASWGAFFLVEWLLVVGLAVWAFDQRGAAGAGLVSVCRLLPGAVALPVGAWLVDVVPRHRLVRMLFVLQTIVIAALLVAIEVGATALVYVLVAASSVVAAPYRPAQLALVPLVARSPQELVAANVAAGVLEGVATLVGPVVAGVLLLGSGPSVVVGLALAGALAGLLAVWTIEPVSDPTRAARAHRESPVGALFGGFRTLRRDRSIALVVAGFGAQLFVRGAMTVLIVVVSFELLDLGQSGVGWLGAALGIGGVVGVFASLGLTARRKLGVPFALGLAGWGLPLAAIGLVGEVPVALAALAVVGVANLVLDVAGLTLLQRLSDDTQLGRIFGVLFTVGTGLAAVGAAVAPWLVDVLGIRGALLGCGLLLAATAVVSVPGLLGIDGRSEPVSEVVQWLNDSSLLGALPATSLEKLAARSAVVTVDDRAEVVREGEVADAVFLVLDGDLSVKRLGQALRTLSTGDHFGEIGLLDRTARTATVVSSGPARLLRVDGAAFVDAVLGHGQAFTRTRALADDRLASDAERER